MSYLPPNWLNPSCNLRAVRRTDSPKPRRTNAARNRFAACACHGPPHGSGCDMHTWSRKSPPGMGVVFKELEGYPKEIVERLLVARR
jgi:hypothetical protein